MQASPERATEPSDDSVKDATKCIDTWTHGHIDTSRVPGGMDTSDADRSTGGTNFLKEKAGKDSIYTAVALRIVRAAKKSEDLSLDKQATSIARDE